MKILIVSQYFYPEEFKINELAEELVKRGHDVTVLTGKPNYPQGQYFEGYRFWGYEKESYKGATVIRVPLINRNNGSSLRLILNYLSYVLFGCLYTLVCKTRFDSIFCFETSPITQIYPALILKKKHGTKVSMWVQDLWPESVSAVGKIKNKTILKSLYKMVRNIYSKCDVLFVQSRAFEDSICEKGDFKNKIIYAPNWAEDIFLTKEIDKSKYKKMFPDGFNVLFAGNIGIAQDFEALINAAEETKFVSDINWIIIGEGSQLTYVKNIVEQKRLDNIYFLGRYPVKEMPHFFVHADVMIVSLKDEYIFSLVIPSKTQAYMASGKPIATMINGEGNQVVKEARCGLVAQAGDYKQLAENIKAMYKLSRSELNRMGINGLNYYNSNFVKDKIITVIENNL